MHSLLGKHSRHQILHMQHIFHITLASRSDADAGLSTNCKSWHISGLQNFTFGSAQMNEAECNGKAQVFTRASMSLQWCEWACVMHAGVTAAPQPALLAGKLLAWATEHCLLCSALHVLVWRQLCLMAKLWFFYKAAQKTSVNSIDYIPHGWGDAVASWKHKH